MLLLYFPVSNADARYWKHLIGLFVVENILVQSRATNRTYFNKNNILTACRRDVRSWMFPLTFGAESVFNCRFFLRPSPCFCGGKVSAAIRQQTQTLWKDLWTLITILSSDRLADCSLSGLCEGFQCAVAVIGCLQLHTELLQSVCSRCSRCSRRSVGSCWVEGLFAPAGSWL